MPSSHMGAQRVRWLNDKVWPLSGSTDAARRHVQQLASSAPPCCFPCCSNFRTCWFSFRSAVDMIVHCMCARRWGVVAACCVLIDVRPLLPPSVCRFVSVRERFLLHKGSARASCTSASPRTAPSTSSGSTPRSGSSPTWAPSRPGESPRVSTPPTSQRYRTIDMFGVRGYGIAARRCLPPASLRLLFRSDFFYVVRFGTPVASTTMYVGGISALFPPV